jgi:hypothetical protein
MRFMMIVKSDKNTEAGVLPSAKDLETMGKYNEELIKAGVLLDGAGLHPSSKGAKVRFSKGGTQVIDGPFVETKELIAGYWILQVKSREEAIEWAKRVPMGEMPGTNEAPEIELRQVFEISDFPDVPQSVVDQQSAFKSNR